MGGSQRRKAEDCGAGSAVGSRMPAAAVTVRLQPVTVRLHFRRHASPKSRILNPRIFGMNGAQDWP